MGILDDKIVHWLATNKLPEDNDLSLLLLEYIDNFSDNDKAALVAELVRHGSTQLSPTVFSFETMDKIYDAQRAIIRSGNFDRFFFHDRGVGINPGRRNPTIVTKIVTAVSETSERYLLCQEFNFFHA
uniref:Uncharacterized protein n=1 Tax=Panagrolaimus davidi TaxID=227884 RepID=A0A914Q208_9BILA